MTAAAALILLYLAGTTLGVRLGAHDWLTMTGLILVGLIPFGALAILLRSPADRGRDRARDGRPRRRPGRARRRLVSDHERRALLHRSRAARPTGSSRRATWRSAAADGGGPAGWSWRAGLSCSALWPPGPIAAIPRASRREARARAARRRALPAQGRRAPRTLRGNAAARTPASRTSAEFSPMPPREGDRVEAAERRRRRGDCGRDPVDVDGEGERALIEVAHVARGARQAGQTGLVLERVVELVDRQRALAQEIQQRAGVDRARAGRHRHALERREAHRRLHRASVEHARSPTSRRPGGRRPAAAPAPATRPIRPTSPWKPYRRTPHSCHRSGTA